MSWCARLTASSAALAAALAVAQPAAGPQFGLIGDTPYNAAEVVQLDRVIAEMNQHPLRFVVHVGDITAGAGPCDDAWLEARQRQFAQWRAPLVLLPGDNEWTDCHRHGFDPLERLARWRSLFCADPDGFPLERQRGPHCEHVRWTFEGLVFVGLNVPGSNNNLGRTAAADTEHEARMRAVFEWLDESAARATRGMVVLMQANPDFEQSARRKRGVPDGFATLRAKLATLPLPLLLVHGDTHNWQDNEPLPGLRRIEVPGSPQVRWVRGVRQGGAFTFD